MPNNPYPIRYVLTDADHMAATFDALERALYERDALAMEEDEGGEVDDASAQQARESVGESLSSMRRAVHEYRKRAERYRASVASAAPAALTDEPTPAMYEAAQQVRFPVGVDGSMAPLNT